MNDNASQLSKGGGMSTVNDVIISFGDDSKRYSRDFQTKDEFKKSWYAVLSRAHASVELRLAARVKAKDRNHFP